MRFAGCCNISCKRIDAVEHSDDLGASRKDNSTDDKAPSTVYLRVCDRVADKKDLAKKWAEALTAGAQKQQPLGNRYDGEDVSAKNPLTKALAARGLSFAKAS
jgi:hypothetical protein